MKRTLLFFFTFIVTIMGDVRYEDFVNRTATFLNLTMNEVHTCCTKTDVTAEDLMHFDQIMIDNLQATADFDDSTFKVGCLYACIAQKKEMMAGAHINVENIKEFLRSKTREYPSVRQDRMNEDLQVMDICADQVKSKTNECEVAVNFIFCGQAEMEKRSNRS